MILALLGCGPPTPTVPGARAWQTLEPLPVPLQEVAVVGRADGTVWVMGGFDDQRFIRDETWILDATGSWSPGPFLPEPLHHMNVAEVEGDLYLLGALGGALFEPTAAAWRLPAGADDWEVLAPVPEPLGAAAVGVVDGRILLAGGLVGRTTAIGYAYVVEEDRWESLPALPGARDHGNGAGGDAFRVFGGRENGLSQVRDDVWLLDDGDWTALAPLPTARAGTASAVLPDGTIAVVGGEGSGRADGTFDEVEAYDPVADAWEVLPALPVGIHGTGAAIWQEGLLLPGGADVQAFAAVDTVYWLPP
jgi:hypothetical protein